VESEEGGESLGNRRQKKRETIRPRPTPGYTARGGAQVGKEEGRKMQQSSTNRGGILKVAKKTTFVFNQQELLRKGEKGKGTVVGEHGRGSLKARGKEGGRRWVS